MLPWPNPGFRGVSGSVVVFLVCGVFVGAGAVLGQPALSWFALAGFSGFVIKWLAGLRDRYDRFLVWAGALSAGVVACTA